MAATRSEANPLSTILRAEVRAVAERAFTEKRYDEAIFAACRDLESYLAARLGSTAIGGGLVDAAFNPSSPLPAIRISNNVDDTQRVNNLFKGVLGVLKGDRSHKVTPSIPCIDGDMCLRALASVSLMYDLLDLEMDAAPAMRAVRSDSVGTLSLDCDRVTEQTAVTFDHWEARVISRNGGVITVALPSRLTLPASILLSDGRRRSQPFRIDRLPLAPQAQASFYKVLRYPIQMYDNDSLSGEPVAAGATLACTEGARQFQRTLPVSDVSYDTGDYVQWQWHSASGDYWYHDEIGNVQKWTGAGLSGDVIGHAGPERLVSIELRPRHVHLRVGERLPIIVLGYVSDGVATWTRDITQYARISSSDDLVAFPTGSSVVGKRLGRATLRAGYEALFDASRVTVGPIVAGEAYEFLGGWRNPVAVAALPRGEIVFANQRSELWRLPSSHKVAPMYDRLLDAGDAYGIDKCCVGGDGEVYFAGPGDKGVLCLHPRDQYQTARTVFRGPQASAIAWTKQVGLVVCTFDKHVWRFDRDQPYLWVTLPHLGVAAAGTDSHLWMVHGGAASGYSTVSWETGTAEGPFLIERVPTSSGIVAVGAQVFVADWTGGQVIRVAPDVDVLAAGLKCAGGMTYSDELGLLVADFESDKVYRIAL